MATRRAILGRIAAGLGALACRGAAGQPAEGAAYVAFETSARTGASRARFLGADGADRGGVPLGFRAHGTARHGRTLVVFPRRPGNRFAVIDLPTLEIRAVVAAPPGRHFYGHGAFDRAGRTLLVTENDLATLAGAVGVYEMHPAPRRAGTLALPRPGPHDIARRPGTDRFDVALGGLMTHPDYGRTPLNLAEFASEVVTLDPARGDLVPMGRWAGTRGVSLRHLASDGRGRLYVGGQRRAGPAGGVLWLVERGRARRIDGTERLGGYVSSVAAHAGRAIVTSKEGGVALHLEGVRVLRTERLAGASAADRGPGLVAASGYALLRLGGARVDVSEGHEFDNHGALLRG